LAPTHIVQPCDKDVLRFLLLSRKSLIAAAKALNTFSSSPILKSSMPMCAIYQNGPHHHRYPLFSNVMAPSGHSIATCTAELTMLLNDNGHFPHHDCFINTDLNTLTTLGAFFRMAERRERPPVNTNVLDLGCGAVVGTRGNRNGKISMWHKGNIKLVGIISVTFHSCIFLSIFLASATTSINCRVTNQSACGTAQTGKAWVPG